MRTVMLLLLVLLAMAIAAPIVNLPGYSGPSLSMDSGYIPIGPQGRQRVFYWLVESPEDPQDKPLLVWFQGGPGCSGLIGLFSENGPLRVFTDSTGNVGVRYEGLAWTNFANVLFLEQPSFVGFSYSNDPNDINCNDTKASLDNFQFLSNWLEAFPQYKGRDTWLTGESYGGVYVPMVTNVILDNPSSTIAQQLKGIMVGNGVMSCISPGEVNIETMNMLYYHGLASYTNYANFTANKCLDPSQATSDACNWIVNQATNQVGAIVQPLKKLNARTDAPTPNWPSLNPDDLFYDFCGGNGTLGFPASLDDPKSCGSVNNDQLYTNYLNRADVQAAIHAKKPNSPWTLCNQNIQYTPSWASMVPMYQRMLAEANPISILIYSGDLDILTVPFAWTQPCVNRIGGKVTNDWQPWFVNGATAGYVQEFAGYTYATVKGAGHEAPQFEPMSSYNMVERFLQTGSLDVPAKEGLRSSNKRLVPSLVRQGDMLRAHRSIARRH